MENEELAKEWYVTHEGRQFGPVSMDDLKYEAERGELNPRLDMVWKNGMEDWIPAGDLEGLFEKNRDAAEVEKAKDTPATITAKPEKKTKKGSTETAAMESTETTAGEWGGTSRSAFLFVTYVLPFLLMIGIALGAPLLAGKVDQNITNIAGGVVGFVLFILILFASITRFPNLGMSRWWWFGLMVPFLNFWLNYRMIACPAGYEEHKKLDTAGWVLAVFYWLVVLFWLVAFTGLIFVILQSPQDFNSPEAIEKLLDTLKKDFTKR